MSTQQIIESWESGVEPYPPTFNTPANWEADLCDHDPDNCWIDRVTGEHVNATTNERTKEHASAN